MYPSEEHAILQGEAGRIFDLVSENVTPEMWATWLEVPLELSSARGDVRLAQKLARAGGKIGISLHEAIRGGHEGTVSALLECGACSRSKDGDGDAPLHVAAEAGHASIARSLLREGADKDALDVRGCTPLHVAAEIESLAVVQVLLAARADLGIRLDDGDDVAQIKESPLDVAAGRGDVGVMRATIEHGGVVVVNAVDPHGYTALHRAAESAGGSAIDVLVEAGADIDAGLGNECSTPLHLAATNTNVEAMVALLKHGAEVNPQAAEGQTPLHCAAEQVGPPGSSETVAVLLRWGADETLKDENGHKPEDVVAEIAAEENYVEEEGERVKMLLSQAPADRAWRRRGFLVLCRAHPDRVRLMMRQERNRTDAVRTMTAPRSRIRAKRAAAEAASTGLERNSNGGGAAEMNVQDGMRIGGEWTVAAGWVLGLQEDGLFRTIIGYL